jgi:hypothetical protein
VAVVGSANRFSETIPVPLADLRFQTIKGNFRQKLFATITQRNVNKLSFQLDGFQSPRLWLPPGGSMADEISPEPAIQTSTWGPQIQPAFSLRLTRVEMRVEVDMALFPLLSSEVYKVRVSTRVFGRQANALPFQDYDFSIQVPAFIDPKYSTSLTSQDNVDLDPRESNNGLSSRNRSR